MAISQIGAVIRRRRLELGLSQEDLADGICSVTTLSRIENGERMPTQNHLEILLQRLGYSDLMFQSFLNEEDMFSMVHIISWIRTEGGTSQRYESWATGYLAYALGLGAVIFIVFTIIETVVKKNRK